MAQSSRMKKWWGPLVYPAPPDGGWGWAVGVAFFLVSVFTYGTIKSFGVFLQDLTSEFGESNSRVSWVVSICAFVMTFTAPLSTVLSNRFGVRPVVMVGGLLISLGTVSTAFTSSINQMYFTVGIVSGLGYCLTFLPTVTILSQYFSTRRSLVTAVASTGESFSVFAFAPAFNVLKEQIGWRYCLVVLGSLQITVVACGALLRPIIIQPPSRGAGGEDEDQLTSVYELENEQTRTSISSGDSGVQSETSVMEASPEKGSFREERAPSPAGRPALLDFSVLRDGGFICYALFGLFATLGFFAPQLYVIELSVSRGVERDSAPYMLSTMAVAELAGRLVVGWVLTRLPFRKTLLLLACVALLCPVLVAFTLVWEFWGLAVCCALYGFLLGTVCSTHIPMLAEKDVVGIDRMASAAGVYVFIQSFAALAGPPLGGYLVDQTKNYGSAFYSCAVGVALGAMFLGLVQPVKAGLCRWTRRPRGEDQGGDSLSQNSADPVDFLEVDLEASPAPSEKSVV